MKVKDWGGGLCYIIFAPFGACVLVWEQELHYRLVHYREDKTQSAASKKGGERRKKTKGLG